MMPTLTSDGVWVGEISELAAHLGFKRFTWPRTITLDSVQFTATAKRQTPDGELEAVVYMADSVKLIVLND